MIGTLSPTEFGTGGFQFSWGDHICGIFDDHEQQMQVMGAFVSAGLIAKQRCVWVGPPASTQALRNRLAEMGGDLPTLEASGQLLLLPEIDFYMRDGLFDADRNLALLHTMLEDNQREGWLTMRFAGDLSYLEHERLDLEEWEAYEAHLTQAVRGLPVVVMCQALRRQLGSAHVVAAFRTHPIIVLGEEIHENPFYLAPAGDAGPEARLIC